MQFMKTIVTKLAYFKDKVWALLNENENEIYAFWNKTIDKVQNDVM